MGSRSPHRPLSWIARSGLQFSQQYSLNAALAQEQPSLLAAHSLLTSTEIHHQAGAAPTTIPDFTVENMLNRYYKRNIGSQRHLARAHRNADAAAHDAKNLRVYPPSPASKAGTESVYETPASTPRSLESALSPGQEMFRSAASTPRAMRRLAVSADSTASEDERGSPIKRQRMSHEEAQSPSTSPRAVQSLTVAMTTILVVAQFIATLLGVKPSSAQAMARPIGIAADQAVRTLCTLAGGLVGVAIALQHELTLGWTGN